MIYKTLSAKEYTPIRRLVLTISNCGRYEIRLPFKTKIVYKNRKAFEDSLEKKENKFYCHICRDFDFLKNKLKDL